MNWAYDLLGVPSDADTATIKRAYARLLRTTRPDEDAAAFQRLNTAYQMALAQAGRLGPRVSLPQSPPGVPPAQAPTAPSRINARPMSPTAPPEAPKPAPPMLPKAPPALETLTPPDPTKSGPASIPAQPSPPEILKPAAAPLRPASAPPPLEVLQPPAPRPTPTIDVAQLARRVIDEACRAEGPLALGNWLAHCPELWSFRIKQITGQLVLQGMAQEARPMQATNFDALLGFFDLNNVLTGLNPVALEQLRNRLAINWERLNDPASLARRVGMLANGQPQTWRVHACIDLLKRPRRWGSTVTVALTRGHATQLARIVHALCNGHIEQLPREIDRKHAIFWSRAAGPSCSSPEQLIVSLIRVLTFALSCTFILSIFTVLAMGSDITIEWRNFRLTPIIMIIGALLAWVTFQGAYWLARWQCQPETTSSNQTASGKGGGVHPWVRRLFIPTAGIADLLSGYLGSPPWISLSVLLIVFLLALRRFDHRASIRQGTTATKLAPIMTAVILPILSGITFVTAKELSAPVITSLLVVILTATLIVWSLDMWRHRALWRRQQAGS